MSKVKITFILQQTDIRRIIREPLELDLDEGGSTIDSIRLADEEILKRAGKFPLKGYKSSSTWFTTPLRTGSTSRSRYRAIQALEPF